MERPILSDKNQYPTEDIIFSHIGNSKSLWNSLFDYIHTDHPDFLKEWKFYKDGNSWLLKVSRKRKTVFWLSIVEDSFRITFYFNDRAEEVIINSDISDELKGQFKSGKRFNKIRGLTIFFTKQKDVEYAKSLIGIKTSLK